MSNLQKLTFNGIPNYVKCLRPIVWRILLGSLPVDTNDWTKQIETNFQTYEDFKRELIVKPQLKDSE